jgi:hypothetical protein
LKHFITLLLVCFLCQSCFAQDDKLEVLEVFNEAETPEMSTGERLKPIIQNGLEQMDGYDLPEDIVETIKIRTMRFNELRGQFDKLKSQSELVKNQMIFINHSINSEAHIFLASIGVPRDDLDRWEIEGNRVKRVSE